MVGGGVLILISILLYARQKIKSGKLAEKQLLYSWLLFLLLTSFFPKLVDEHHSAALWLGLAMSLAWLLEQLKYPRIKMALAAILIVSMVANNHLLRTPNWDENMPRTRTVGQLIAEDALHHQEQQVNVASLVDADARATRFRYFVLRYGQDLLGIDQYDHSRTLYVISHQQPIADMLQNPAWEISSFQTESFVQLWTDGEWILWKATKANPAN